jgi:hypothetical protein
MSTMTSLVRPFLSSMLCCVIAFGHAPAWLHVATCDDHGSEASFFAKLGSATTAHTCGCHGHACDPSPTDGDTSQESSPHESKSHDSDNCAICQSLAAPSGFVSDHFALPRCGFVFEQSVCRSTNVFARSAVSWPPLRGPPAQGLLFAV